MKFLVLLWILLISPLTFGAQSKVEKRDHVLVSLISEYDQIDREAQFKIGLKFVIAKDWHIYWKNPGDSGTAPKVTWNNPENIKISGFKWPTPKIFPIPPLANYGYEKEVIFPMDVSFRGDKFEIEGEVEWLVCKVECIPGQAKLNLSLPIGQEKLSNAHSLEISKYLSQNPIHAHDIELSLDQDDKNFYLSFSSKELNLSSFEKFYFFPHNGTYIAHAEPQGVSWDDNDLVLTAKKSDYLVEAPTLIAGVLELEKKGEPRLSFEVVSQGRVKTKNLSIWMALLFAFLGGLILNLMPCVFPVISIKILGFVDSSQKTNTQISAHGWAYTFGVLTSFLILSGLLVLLRSLGQSLGWGFQLQSPYFISFMVILFYLIALNLFGMFEVGENLVGIGAKISREKSYAGSFFTGVLATLVATPCTAPFMGSALGFAITLPPTLSILIFLMLGFGMAFPYLILCYFPRWIRKLPKPGPWMATFKEILAFPMLLTVLWLLWVLSFQAQMEVVLYILLFLLALTFAIWSLKKFKKSIVKWILFLSSLLSSGFLLIHNLSESSPQGTQKQDEVWVPYSEEVLAKYREEGTPVFVDFTAAWCITCQVNKRVVLNTDDIQLAFKNAGVILMKADWTNKDPVITKALESFDRNSVPLYVLYTKNKNEKPFILPEILTKDIVLNNLKKL